MSILFRENRDYIYNAFPYPIGYKANDLVKAEFNCMNELVVTVKTLDNVKHELVIPSKLVHSVIGPHLGITSFLRKEWECHSLGEEFENHINAILKDLFTENLEHYIFYLDEDIDAESNTVLDFKPMFDSKLNPIDADLTNLKENQKVFLPLAGFDRMTSNLEEDIEFNDFDLMKSRNVNIDTSLQSDIEAPIRVHILMSGKASEGQFSRIEISLEDIEYKLNYLITKNYGKSENVEYKDLVRIGKNIISTLHNETDMSDAFQHTLESKCPSAGLAFMMDHEPSDKTWLGIRKCLSSAIVEEKAKKSTINAVGKCLGYMITSKLFGCHECGIIPKET